MSLGYINKEGSGVLSGALFEGRGGASSRVTTFDPAVGRLLSFSGPPHFPALLWLRTGMLTSRHKERGPWNGICQWPEEPIEILADEWGGIPHQVSNISVSRVIFSITLRPSVNSFLIKRN